MPSRPQPFARARVERLIGTARVALAASSLFGIWLDPSEPARFVHLTYTLHVVYLGYALALAAVMWRRDSSGPLPVATHVADIIVASVFQYLTLGPSSPFFTYFVFAVFSAALRWGWEATVRTAASALVMFIALSLWLSRTLGATEYEADRFVIRSVYLVVVTIVLVFLGRHEARLREEIGRLARWPVPRAIDWTESVPQVVHHAAGILGAASAVLVWNENEEPWTFLASWNYSGFQIARHSPHEVDPVVPEHLRDACFVSPDSVDASMQLSIRRGPTVGRSTGLPVHSALVPLLRGTGVASAPFTTTRVSGRVFFSDLVVSSAELMPLVEVVGREIGISLDQISANRQARQSAILQDRTHVARDLHDGVLQSLTGIRLSLQNMADQSRASAWPPAIEERLRGLERTLASEQYDLRRFIEALRPASVAPAGVSLSERLEELRSRMTVEWQAAIAVNVNPVNLTVPLTVDRAVPLLVREAIVNALKHGQPSHVSVDVAATDAALRIVVIDDGPGFAFQGRRNHAELAATSTGPRSLRERVEMLGGHIVVESSPAGSRVELSMPFEPVHA